VSLRNENNFALNSANSGAPPSLCGPYYSSALLPVDATVQLSRLVDEHRLLFEGRAERQGEDLGEDEVEE
jgi:hypothetical protein